MSRVTVSVIGVNWAQEGEIMKSLSELSADVLRDAARDGIIDTVLTGSYPLSVTPEFLAYAQSQRAIEYQDPNTFEPLEHPKSTRYQESVFSAALHQTVTDYWAVELARIVVPKGSVGFLTGIDQVLNDVDGNYYPSNQEYWGSPTFVISDVDNCRWYLTMESFYGPQPARFNLSLTVPIPPEALPGMPYPELFAIPGLWYPAHNGAGSPKFELIIPGAKMVRFFFSTPPTTFYQWQVSGRLRGYTQTTYSREAKGNARMIF